MGISAAFVLALVAVPASAKTGRTLYGPERIANMRQNLAQYGWAQELRDTAVAKAEPLLKLSYEQLARYVPDPAIPRAAYVHETGCPNCGLAVRKYGTYPWIITMEKPYKVECPNCHNVYPSNDFQKFLDSGTKDRSLLTGDYPDDGWGWAGPKDPEHKYWFVAYYNHWMTRQALFNALRYLSQAYLYTDEPAYAQRCGLLLWQLAAYYPGYDYAKQSRKGIEHLPDAHGRLFYHTWETDTVVYCSEAYDAVFPGLTQSCPELEQFTGQSTEQMRHLIEEQLLRSMAADIVSENGLIAGNYGSHQMGLLAVAATLKDTPGTPSSDEMVRWMLNNEEYHAYVYMPMYDALYNLIGRDGVPFESPSYNRGWIGTLTEVAEMLRANGVDVFREPRFRRLYDWPIQMLCAGRFTPAIGDSGVMSNRQTMLSSRAHLTAFRTYEEPLYAKALHDYCTTSQIRDIFHKPLDDEIAAAAANIEPLGYSDQHLPAYGLAILQNENPQAPIATSLYYGMITGHSHHDRLQLDIFAQNASMIPDFGYPETCNSNDPRKPGFFSHVVSHNTVMVDQTDQRDVRGRCLAYDTGPVCQYVEAQIDNVYPQCNVYRRSVAMVEVSPAQAYFIDVFRVRGGSQHDWLLHGTEADFESNMVLSSPQTEGTLAGPQVKYGQFYDDAKLRDVPYGSVSYFSYKGSGFQFLYNMQQAPLQPGACARWNLVTTKTGDRKPVSGANPGAFLKAYLVGQDEQVFVCDGKPQQNTQANPDSVKFVIRRRSGENLNSTFVTVLEPGAGEELISRVERIATGSEDLVALRIGLTSGAIHYYFNAPQALPETEIADGIRFAGQVGYLALDKAGAVERAYLHNATLLVKGQWKLTADAPLESLIVSCDYGGNSITLADPVAETDAVVGSTVAVNTGRYGGSFVVEKVEGDRKLCFGDQDPISARLVVKETLPKQRQIMTTNTGWASVPFLSSGMRLVTEALVPVARIVGYSMPLMELDGDFSPDMFTDANGDGVVRAWVMEYGPGDKVLIPTSARYQR